MAILVIWWKQSVPGDLGRRPARTGPQTLWGLGGGCLVPIGSLTKVEGHSLTLRAMVLNPAGTRRVVDTHRGPIDQPVNVGAELAARLLSAGARELLD